MLLTYISRHVKATVKGLNLRKIITFWIFTGGTVLDALISVADKWLTICVSRGVWNIVLASGEYERIQRINGLMTKAK